MNPDAGRAMWLFMTVELEDGEPLPFFVDTGTTRTLLDKSLAPTLGKRLGDGTADHFGAKLNLDLYAAPTLRLGGARLKTGPEVGVCDLTPLAAAASRPVKGILGMDCLKHYCLQLDFQTETVRFLDPEQIAGALPGKTFPLDFYQDCPFIRHASLAGGKAVKSLIDTGCIEDGMLGNFPGRESGAKALHLDDCIWEGETHTNLCVSLSDHLPLGRNSSSLGLRFLARHLVTLNFPQKTMSLAQTSVGPLVYKDLAAAMDFLHRLKAAGLQPGWSKEDQGSFAWPESFANSFTFHISKNGDRSIYHYVVSRAAKGVPWKLEKAWRTDEQGRTLEEYAVSEVAAAAPAGGSSS